VAEFALLTAKGRNEQKNKFKSALLDNTGLGGRPDRLFHATNFADKPASAYRPKGRF
jgi:hypothetical protein